MCTYYLQYVHLYQFTSRAFTMGRYEGIGLRLPRVYPQDGFRLICMEKARAPSLPSSLNIYVPAFLTAPSDHDPGYRRPKAAGTGFGKRSKACTPM